MKLRTLTFLSLLPLLAGCRGCGNPEDEATAPSALHGSAAIIAGHLDPIPEDEPWFTDDQGFRRYFERMGRLRLSDSIAVGKADSPEIAPDGRMAVVDRIDKAAFLLGPDGSLIAELTAEGCDPDYPWAPFRARFYANGELLVTNLARAEPLVFDASGRCERNFEGLMNVRFVTPAAQNSAVGYMWTSEGHRLNWYRPGDSVVVSVTTGTDFLNLTRNYVSGDIRADGDGKAYVAMLPEAAVAAYDPDGRLIGRLGYAPLYYHPVEKDIPDGLHGPAAFRAAQPLLKDAWVPAGLAFLDRDRLLVSYVNATETDGPEAQGIQVVATDGTVLTPGPIRIPFQQAGLTAADGIVYRMDRDEEAGPATVVVYRFVGGG